MLGKTGAPLSLQTELTVLCECEPVASACDPQPCIFNKAAVSKASASDQNPNTQL